MRPLFDKQRSLTGTMTADNAVAQCVEDWRRDDPFQGLGTEGVSVSLGIPVRYSSEKVSPERDQPTQCGRSPFSCTARPV
jgi:hypothetical protein